MRSMKCAAYSISTFEKMKKITTVSKMNLKWSISQYVMLHFKVVDALLIGLSD